MSGRLEILFYISCKKILIISDKSFLDFLLLYSTLNSIVSIETDYI